MRPKAIYPDLLRDDVSVQEAERLQDEYRSRIQLHHLPVPDTVTGVDIAYQTTDSTGAVAAAVTMAIPSLKVIETAQITGACTFPYMPGLLGFRELNLVSRAICTLEQPIEVILYDGHGFAHPRHFGAASQLGLAFGIPSIGCAKRIFHGSIRDKLGPEQFAKVSIQDDVTSEIIGVAIRMELNVKPVYISSGYLVDLESAVDIVKKCAGGFRLPEPIRQADAMARKYVRFFED